MLSIESLAYLRSPAGERLLATARAVESEAATPLQALNRLRRETSPELAGAALETLALRRRAARKFRLAEQMFFTADALEQATGETVAAHRARRFAGCDAVADLCCGAGGDAIALAKHCRVTAVDHDPLRLALAQANAEAYGVTGRITFLLGDALTVPLTGVDAAFCDPGRRGGQGRVFDPRRYQPPLPAVLVRAASLPAFAVKVAPGIPYDAVPPACEAEFVEERGELKEAVLWLGRFAQVERRATLLPPSHTLVARPGAAVTTGPPLAYLYEPAPAVIRSHLVAELAQDLGAVQIDETIAYLTTHHLTATPFATAYAIEEWLPFNLKALRARLRQLDVGTVVVKKRGSPLDPQELEAMLRLQGKEYCTLVLTRVQGRHAVLICSGPLR